MNILSSIVTAKKEKRKAFAILIDPDKINLTTIGKLVSLLTKYPPDYLLVGGSLIAKGDLDEVIGHMKAAVDIPILIFPGSFSHISTKADGILLLSLISGRNPNYLIGQHVEAAPILARSGLEIIPTGYMIVACGRQTTVSYVSNTFPIPYDKPDIAAVTALAGQQLGLQLIYADGGSGAERPISTTMIRAIADCSSIPLVIGGGIHTVTQAQNAYDAGADLLIVGTAIEKDPGFLIQLARLKDNVNSKKN